MDIFYFRLSRKLCIEKVWFIRIANFTFKKRVVSTLLVDAQRMLQTLVVVLAIEFFNMIQPLVGFSTSMASLLLGHAAIEFPMLNHLLPDKKSHDLFCYDFMK